MKAKYRVVVLGFLKNLNTEKEVVEEYRKYLSTIFLKKQVMSFSVIYEDGEKRGAIVATGRQISIISGSEEMISLAYKMRTSWEKKMKIIKDTYGCLSCFLKQKTKINIKRKLGETRKYEIIYELKKPMCGFFEREILKCMLINAGFEEFSYICRMNKKLIRVDKEEKTMLPIIGICFQSKVFYLKKRLSIIHHFKK